MLRLATAIVLGLIACLTLGGCGHAPRDLTTVSSHSTERVVYKDRVTTQTVTKELHDYFRWAIGISLAGFGVSIAIGVGLASLIPGIGKYAIAAGIGFAAVFTLALLGIFALPFLPWIALVMLGLLVFVSVLYAKGHISQVHAFLNGDVTPQNSRLVDVIKGKA